MLVQVLGATSMIGDRLVPRLAAAGCEVERFSRRPPDADGWRALDLERPGPWRARAGAVVVSLVPITTLTPAIPALAPARLIVALSTTSLHAKGESRDPAERAFVRGVAEAEAGLAALEAPATILRPTLVWEAWRDRNVSAIARVIARFGVFPVAAPGKGLRQPIHADDVAAAITAAVFHPGVAGRAFDLGGGEVLRYDEMVRRIFRALGRPPRLVKLPAVLLAGAFRAAGLARGHVYSPSLFARMNQDLAFDDGDARLLLGHAPRGFLAARELIS